MKKLISTISMVCCLLLFGCDETEALLGGNIFNLKYTAVDGTIPVSQVRLWAEASDSQLATNADTFFPVADPTTNLNPDEIVLFGDPNTAQSSLEIYMDRGGSTADFMNTIRISLSGPFVENQEITSGIVEVTFGDLPNNPGAITFDYDGTADTYFSFTITNISTVSNTIGGNFHMLLTNIEDRSSDPVSIYEGAFSWNLD